MSSRTRGIVWGFIRPGSCEMELHRLQRGDVWYGRPLSRREAAWMIRNAKGLKRLPGGARLLPFDSVEQAEAWARGGDHD